MPKKKLITEADIKEAKDAYDELNREAREAAKDLKIKQKAESLAYTKYRKLQEDYREQSVNIPDADGFFCIGRDASTYIDRYTLEGRALYEGQQVELKLEEGVVRATIHIVERHYKGHGGMSEDRTIRNLEFLAVCGFQARLIPFDASTRWIRARLVNR